MPHSCACSAASGRSQYPDAMRTATTGSMAAATGVLILLLGACSGSSSESASASNGQDTPASASPSIVSTTAATGSWTVPSNGPVIDPGFLAYMKRECENLLNIARWVDSTKECIAEGDVNTEVSLGVGDGDAWTGYGGDVVPQQYFLLLVRDLVTSGNGDAEPNHFTCPDGSPVADPSQECLVAAAGNWGSPDG